MKFASALFAALASAAALAAPPPLEALAGALHASAHWDMVKTVPALDAPLASSGFVDCTNPTTIVWRATSPFAECLTLTPTLFLHEVDDEPCVTNEFAHLPHYRQVRRVVEDLRRGEFASAERLFAVTNQTDEATGAWSVSFTPRDERLRALFASAELSGEGTSLTGAVWRTTAGETTRIAFRP